MAGRRRIRWLVAATPPFAAVVAAVVVAVVATVVVAVAVAATAEPPAQKQSVRVRVDGQAIEVLGLSWNEGVVRGTFEVRDPAQDSTLRVVTLAVSDRDRGVFAVPALGDEVVLEFLEGDPDRPIVLGLLSPKVDEVALGDDDKDGRWVSVRISFRAVRRAKGNPSDG